MSPPAVASRLLLERAPVVYPDCLDECEEARLWLDLSDEERALIAQARALGERGAGS